MDQETLRKANELDKKIREFEEALNCFEWENDGKMISTNPRLLIEYDNDGREVAALPMNLSKALVDYLKQEIKKGMEAAMSEFNDLIPKHPNPNS